MLVFKHQTVQTAVTMTLTYFALLRTRHCALCMVCFCLHFTEAQRVPIIYAVIGMDLWFGAGMPHPKAHAYNPEAFKP